MIDKYKMPVLIYSRVSGYYNPTINFNKGKQAEFADRKMLDIKKATGERICTVKS